MYDIFSDLLPEFIKNSMFRPMLNDIGLRARSGCHLLTQNQTGVSKLQGPGGIHGPPFDSGLSELLAEDELRPGTAVHIAATYE